MIRLLKPWVCIDQGLLFVIPHYNAVSRKSQRSDTRRPAESLVKLRSMACHWFLLNHYLKSHLHFDNARGQTQTEQSALQTLLALKHTLKWYWSVVHLQQRPGPSFGSREWILLLKLACQISRQGCRVFPACLFSFQTKWYECGIFFQGDI